MGRLGSTMDYYTDDKKSFEQNMAELGLTFEQMIRYEGHRRNLVASEAKLTLPNLRRADRINHEKMVKQETEFLQEFQRLGRSQKAKTVTAKQQDKSKLLMEGLVLPAKNDLKKTDEETIRKITEQITPATSKAAHSNAGLMTIPLILIAVVGLIAIYLIRRKK